jgi:23S rRNA (cytidine1920-2'-O)/16S rRNA (cytidine1409-2'-O)-methyltransferase
MNPEGAKPKEQRPESEPSQGESGAQPAGPAPAKRPSRQRLDLLLVERELVESRERARRLILAGEVRVGGEIVDKAGALVAVDAPIDVRERLPYVSRGGLKLAAALDAFGMDVEGLVAVDVGASTGGFSDCLLQRGVGRIFAVDVGYGQLAWKVRSDPRVVALDRTNIRNLESLPGGVLASLAVIDASFISLALVLPPTLNLLTPDARIVALVKPQFEAGRAQVGKGGVVRDPRIHREVIERTAHLAGELGLHVAGVTVSPAPGPAGNVEFLLLLERHPLATSFDLHAAVERALDDAASLTRRSAPSASEA